MIYEIRDHPDDLPLPCDTLAEARKRARQRARKLGSDVLIYAICPLTGEKLIAGVAP